MAAQRQERRIRFLGLLVLIAGAILLVAGVGTYVLVSTTLADQNITVADDADRFAGQQVTQPWQAYAQAEVINDHATEIGGGKTYAELPQDDPNRETVMNASFLQASLFTSVLAFGVAALAVGLGVVFDPDRSRAALGCAAAWSHARSSGSCRADPNLPERLVQRDADAARTAPGRAEPW